MPPDHGTSTNTLLRSTAAGKLKRTLSNDLLPTKKLRATTKQQMQHLDYSNVPSDWLDASNHQDADQQSLELTYHQVDIFADAPKGCVLIHACNTRGHWGAGIAKAFKQQYPNAYVDHNKFCAKDHTNKYPVQTGTTQLLAPCDGDMDHWIGCMFTSAKYGKGKDKPDQIIRNTIESMQMLLELISQVDKAISEIRMCKINSGKFGVPWEKTEEALRCIALKPEWRSKIEVWEPKD